MECELWTRLYHLVMEEGQTLRLIDLTDQPHIIVSVFLWAALHDRPVKWAFNPRHCSTTSLRPSETKGVSEAMGSRRGEGAG